MMLSRAVAPIACLLSLGLAPSVAGARPATPAESATPAKSPNSAIVTTPATAVARPPDTRPVSAAEQRSFDQFQRQYDPAPGAGKARLMAERPAGKGPWQLSATMETPPRLAMPGVCQLERSVFRHVPQAPDGQPWRADGMALPYVWLAVAGPCVAPARPVRLLQALPPEVVLQLLKENAALLNRARLLFAGNTQCARLRALPFALDALGRGPRANGAPTIYTLLFRGERGELAQVDARYSRAELTAWNVSCPAP
ncbi:hypothetical protein H3H39_19705 [Duganella sp. LX47W]|uniref:Uncharacterized protein n=1 Tax=Rugamonas apoptosis TaxID=2758570 RepID=A0A7W2FCQ5_9BURK|nr:hypothetical protein [Rugamonas apoptosis]